MTAGPLPATQALPAKALNELSVALRDRQLDGDASTFVIRNAVPAVGEAAASELCALLASGLSASHAALLVDSLAAAKHHKIGIELVTSGPDAIGTSRDTGVVLREL